MSEIVESFAQQFPRECFSNRCEKDGCKVVLDEVLTKKVVLDLDCENLDISNDSNKCDYLCIGARFETTWVIPIELKSGRFNASHAVEQLKFGVTIANRNLPTGISFQLNPILAHGKGIHRHVLTRLRSKKIRMRGQIKGTKLIRCGARLSSGLG